jgi:hypothetical protein
MHIYQAGHESAVAKVDGFGSGLMTDLRTNFDNALAADEDFPWCDHFSRFDIEHAGGVEDDRMGLSLCNGHRAAEYCERQVTHNW